MFQSYARYKHWQEILNHDQKKKHQIILELLRLMKCGTTLVKKTKSLALDGY